MKILWFTSTPSLYDNANHHYNGVGWIESLESLLRNQVEIELAVSFFHNNDFGKTFVNGNLYFPIKQKRGRTKPLKTLIDRWHSKLTDEDYSEEILEVINDFKPDLIHVFGTESYFALIQQLTKIPILVHIQGLINPYLFSFFPPGYSKYDILFNFNFIVKNLNGTSLIQWHRRFKYQAEREKKILNSISYVCGRTRWDRSVVKVFNPKIKYFHIDEVLRPLFYNIRDSKKVYSCSKICIVSTLSPTIYKGIDVVLKTAFQLTRLTNLNFEWKIIGIDESSDLLKLFEFKEQISYKSVSIKLLGILSSEQIINELSDCDIYVHPSYIDNSPNSICEAQIAGLPVIASNTGGIPTLVTHNKTGFLVPPNGIYEIIHYIIKIVNDPILKNRISKSAREEALIRHNRDKIINDLLNVYKEVVFNL